MCDIFANPPPSPPESVTYYLNGLLGETYPKLNQALQQRERRTASQPTSVRDLKTEPGKGKGLLVILESHSDVLSASSLDEETIGFVGLITQGGNFPQKKLGGFDIRPGARVIKLFFRM